jgi:putative ABC transport system ATP-binding protein
MHDDGAAILVEDLVHTIGHRALFDGLHLTASTGRVHAVTGSSGVGKSTLLRVLGGIERPAAGMVRVFDDDVPALAGRRLRHHLRHRVGFVFQDAGLVERWTVRQDLAAAGAAVPREPVSTPARCGGGAGSSGPPTPAPRPTLQGAQRRRTAARGDRPPPRPQATADAPR